MNLEQVDGVCETFRAYIASRCFETTPRAHSCDGPTVPVAGILCAKSSRANRALVEADMSRDSLVRGAAGRVSPYYLPYSFVLIFGDNRLPCRAVYNVALISRLFRVALYRAKLPSLNISTPLTRNVDTKRVDAG